MNPWLMMMALPMLANILAAAGSPTTTSTLVAAVENRELVAEGTNSFSDDSSNSTRPDEYPLDYSKVIISYKGDSNTTLHVYGASSNCYHCTKYKMYHSIGVLPGRNGVLSPVNCKYPFDFEFIVKSTESIGDSGRSIANYTLPCGDHGVYHIIVDSTPTTEKQGDIVTSHVVREPRRWWVPIVILSSIVIVAIVIAAVADKLYTMREKKKSQKRSANQLPLTREIVSDESDTDPLLGEAPAPEASTGSSSRSLISESVNNDNAAHRVVPASQGRRRVVSLDVFRGITITAMIFVNAGGGGYQFFDHATWNGFCGADLVFPWFLWISGVSAALSRGSGVCFTGPSKARLWGITVRFVELFVLGLFLNNGKDLGKWRIGGILQRIALSSFIVSLVAIFTPKLFRPKKSPGGAPHAQKRIVIVLGDMAPFLLEYVVILAIVGVHTGLTFGLDVPGCGRGYLGPGGDHEYGRYANCTGGAAGYIDRVVFGEDHMLTKSWMTAREVYNTTVAFDPEGILGTLTCVFMLYLGFQAGRTLMIFQGHLARVGRWFGWGVVLLGIGIGLCGGTKNEGIIPMNKNLFSLSYACVLGGAAFVCLGIVYFIVDALGVWGGAPFKPAGMNSIALYVLSLVLYNYFPFYFTCPDTHPWQLARATVTTVSWIVVSYVLYAKEIFIKLG